MPSSRLGLSSFDRLLGKGWVVLVCAALAMLGCGDCGDDSADSDGSAQAAEPSCTDLVHNGDEEEVDCGGPCEPCTGTRLPAPEPRSSDNSPIREYSSWFEMPIERDGCTTLHRPHSQRRWSVFMAGRCAGCSIPSRISSAAYGDNVLVSWAASAAYAGIEEPGGRRYGHLSTFKFTEADGFEKVSDFHFPQCDFDMGSVAVSPDGSVIGALCLAKKEDLEDNRRNMFLYEWTGGEVTQTPDTVKLLSGSAGGWNYGHWDLSLNNDLTHYFVEQKATGGGHETELHYAIDRANDHEVVKGQWTDGSNCGGGHTISNRITHNKADDTWSVFCALDSRKMRWHPVPNQKYEATEDNPALGLKAGKRASIVTIGEFSTPGEIGVAAGGVANMVSLGSRGWLAAGLGPFDVIDGTTKRDERPPRLVNQQIGLRRLPLTIAEFVENEDDYPWNWIPIDDLCAPTRGADRRVGMPQLHNWGPGGEDSERILLGYAPSMKHPGRGNEFHVVEIDENGELLHDPVLLRSGWGVDSLGTHMPESGCVVFPHTWLTDDTETLPEFSYPKHEAPADKRSAFLKLTAVCPTGQSFERTDSGQCQTQWSELVQEVHAAETPVEAECPLPGAL